MKQDQLCTDFQASPFAGMIVTGDGSILETTRKLADEFSPIPTNFYELLQPQDKNFQDVIARVISAGVPASIEARLSGGPDGNKIRFLLIPLGGRLADRVAVLLSSQDETTIFREKLAKMKYRLDAIQHEFEDLCFSVSHDVRNPLVLIDGFSQALIEDYGEQLQGEAKFYLQRIRAAGRKMAQLIDDLLSISRIMRVEMECKPVDLTIMMREIVKDKLNKVEGRQVQVHVAEGMEAFADAKLLNIICQQLIDNAFKFTGRVTEAIIDIGSMKIDGEEAFYIRDNGVGFRSTDAEKIFQPFQKLHSAEEFAGTGTGLALVKRAIERHGGSVWGEGASGKGATFFFRLPLGKSDGGQHE